MLPWYSDACRAAGNSVALAWLATALVRLTRYPWAAQSAVRGWSTTKTSNEESFWPRRAWTMVASLSKGIDEATTLISGCDALNALRNGTHRAGGAFSTRWIVTGPLWAACGVLVLPLLEQAVPSSARALSPATAHSSLLPLGLFCMGPHLPPRPALCGPGPTCVRC